jgi:hypothetical protein
MIELRLGMTVFTACLIGLVFVICSQSRFWRQFLVGAFGISSVLAALGFLLLAA